jgi:hypothetical protein
MRGALHVLATLATVPYLLLAAAFSIGGHAIGAGSLWGALDTLLAHFLWIVPWGALGFAVVIVTVAVLGAYPPTRRLGGLLLALLAGAALAVIVLLGSGPLDAGQLLFLVPCALALACGAWLATSAPAAAAAIA